MKTKFFTLILLILFASRLSSVSQIPIGTISESVSEYDPEIYSKYGILASYNIRSLTEINKTDTADAYPYLSPDGLRLYFAQGVPGYTHLYVMSRNNVSAFFSNKQLLSSTFTSNQQKGCWLTNNELEIFFIDNDILYYSSRPSISSPFSIPQIVSLNGLTVTTILGPSLSPDKEELYINAIGTNKSTLRFQKTANLQYTLTDTVQLPANYTAGPGQLSKDGLKFYTALFISAENRTRLFQYSRASLSSQFTSVTLMPLDVSINDIVYASNTHPTVSADENIIVWVRNACGIVWNDNEMFIATDVSIGKAEWNFETRPVIYPNPAIERIHIDGVAAPCQMIIYNRMGQMVNQQVLQNRYNAVEIDQLPAGIYHVALQGAENFMYKLMKIDHKFY